MTFEHFFGKIKSMKTILKHFKPYDYLLIGLTLLISLSPWFYTFWQAQQPQPAQLVAIVKIKGEIVDQFDLVSGGEKKLVTYYPDEGQYNIVEIDGDRIRVKEDNSPDQIAVRTGWASQAGQVLVCLPHQLVIEIQGQGTGDDELILPF